ncbi:unnamed protein product [Brugia timori]|uniref:Uncharacterized protein n=1 Tax=Brugia timori TaxID=42155 RepID=A0A0R3Q460_9BILA|nr:unnamed protein product [Brugia timori]
MRSRFLPIFFVSFDAKLVEYFLVQSIFSTTTISFFIFGHINCLAGKC